MKNPKKGPFDLSVDLDKIPSFGSRFASMDGLTGRPVKMEMEETDVTPALDAHSLRAKLGSNQDIRSTPSIILRRKGVRV